MAHITASVEYGIHSLLWLIGQEGRPMSSRELAELSGVSPTFLAKIFPKLEKAGIVRAAEGVRGGYLLAKPPKNISFMEIIDAIEGEKPLFDCREVRLQCPLFGKDPPGWAAKGTCAIHAVMLRAEKAMREALASQSLGDVAETFGRKAPSEFWGVLKDWLEDNAETRVGKPEPVARRRHRRAR
jgi:Rrf2 family protein